MPRKRPEPSKPPKRIKPGGVRSLTEVARPINGETRMHGQSLVALFAIAAGFACLSWLQERLSSLGRCREPLIRLCRSQLLVSGERPGESA